MDHYVLRKVNENQRSGGFRKNKRFYTFRAIIWIMGWIAPPLAILVRFGFGWDFLINIILTILGYFPGHIHNFYCQTVRENTNKKRAPKWAVKHGLVNVEDPRGGKHKWARRYDERLPDSYRDNYLNESGEDVLGQPGAVTSTWDGRGPEPERVSEHKRTGFSPWNNEVTPDQVEGDFDPISQEQFYNSNTTASGSRFTDAPQRKKKGLKGLIPHKSRYFGGSKTNHSSASTAYPPSGAYSRQNDYIGNSGNDYGNEFHDDFEAEINGVSRNSRQTPTTASKPERLGSTFVDDFEAEINGGSIHNVHRPPKVNRKPDPNDPFVAAKARYEAGDDVTDADLFNHTF